MSLTSQRRPTSLPRPRPLPHLAPPLARRLVLLGLLAVGAGLSALTSLTAPAPSGDPMLGWMLRMMTILKAGMVGAAVALLWLRMRHDLPASRVLGYGLGLALAAAALVGLWSLHSIGLWALIFYLGMGTLVTLAWTDPAIRRRA